MRYWIKTVSHPQLLDGVTGKDSRLQRLARGDVIVFYAPAPAKQFTAIGEVGDDSVALRPATEAPIHPLIEQLDFIRNKKQWGFPFRRGLFEIGEADFERISRAMSG